MLVELGQSSFSFFCFVDQPNLRLKLAATLGKTVLKLGNPNSTSIVVTLLNENKKNIHTSWPTIGGVSQPVMLLLALWCPRHQRQLPTSMSTSR